MRGIWDIVRAVFMGLVFGSCASPFVGFLYMEAFGKSEEERVLTVTARYILSATCLGVAASLYWTSTRRLSAPLRSIANGLALLFLILGIVLAVRPPF